MRSESLECEISSLRKKSLSSEEEGVLTRRHNILKEQEIIKLMKSMNSAKKSNDSTSGAKSCSKTSRQQEAETINSAAKTWKCKVLDKKKENINPARKRKVFKQKSKSIDNTLEEKTSAPSLDTKHSHSCSELTQDITSPLYSIQEEEGGNQTQAWQGSFRRKIFARSKTQQMTQSMSSGSSLRSLKSSINQSLSSLKKQVSFDDSLSSELESRVSVSRGRVSTTLEHRDRSLSRVSSASTSAAGPDSRDVKYVIGLWSGAAIYCMMNKQDKSELCSISEGMKLCPQCLTQSVPEPNECKNYLQWTTLE